MVRSDILHRMSESTPLNFMPPFETGRYRRRDARDFTDAGVPSVCEIYSYHMNTGSALSWIGETNSSCRMRQHS